MPGLVWVGVGDLWVQAKGPELAQVEVGELDMGVGGYLKVPMLRSGLQHLCKFASGITLYSIFP